MIKVRLHLDRGHVQKDWLDTYHSFSFAEYFDDRFLGFRTLRVINEDRVLPGSGFSTHSHKEMEILTYVVSGALEHKDSMGNGSVIRPGDIQIMSAGTGIEHSEFNPSEQDKVHLLQIWVRPNKKNLQPRYQQPHFSVAQRQNALRLIASEDGRQGSVTIHQDIHIMACIANTGSTLTYDLRRGSGFWFQLISGCVKVNNQVANPGDGLYSEDVTDLKIDILEPAEFLLFDIQ
jgi:redox-sensitive bicupin YhaK (pirin superfamily)